MQAVRVKITCHMCRKQIAIAAVGKTKEEQNRNMERNANLNGFRKLDKCWYCRDCVRRYITIKDAKDKRTENGT